MEALLKKIFKEKSASIKQRLLGGMMNETYIISCENNEYVLYIPQGTANEIVDREEEKHVQNIASSLNLTSKNIFFDTKTGIKCNEYIEGDSINNVEEYDYSKVAILLKKFHNSKQKSHYSYDPFIKLENYLKTVTAFTKLNDDFYKLYNILLSNKEFLEKQKLTLSHNDFQKSNIVRTSKNEYFVIDFEFVANNDPIYDIAAFGNNSVEEGRKLLSEYYKKSLTATHIKRFYLWRILISLQWFLVALIKDNNGEGKIHNFDFKNVANSFLQNANVALEGLNIELK